MTPSALVSFVRSLTAFQRLGIGTATIFLLSAGLTFGWVLLRRPGRERLPDQFPPGPRLAMEASAQGDGLLLTWNGGLAGAYNAKGVMFIDDATQHREVRLDHDELASGVMLYRPVSNNILFQLRLSDDRGKTLIDRLRRVGVNRAGENFSKGPVQAGVSTLPLAPSVREARKSAPAQPRPSGQDSNRPGNLPKPHVMSAPAYPQPVITHLATDMAFPEPALPGSRKEPVEIASLSPPESMPFEGTPPLNPPDFWPLPDAPGTSGADISQDTLSKYTISQDGRKPGVPPYVVARLHTKVMPDPKILAYSVQNEVTLQLEIRIDEKGRVSQARVIKHSAGVNSEIEDASLAAVKQWSFEPARSYGSEVASNYMVFLRFGPAPRP